MAKATATEQTLTSDGEGDNPNDDEARYVRAKTVDLEIGESMERSMVLVSSGGSHEGDGSGLVGREQICSETGGLKGGNGEGGAWNQTRTNSSPWVKKQSDGSVAEATVNIVDGVASIAIPEEIFDEAELLWKRYVVGYFIGDAPHVGSIHVTVNRIWSSSKAGSKIDVQFIEKNTVLF